LGDQLIWPTLWVLFMSKYCPRWVFDIVVTQACYDYVRLDSVAGAGLLVISHKYLSGLKKLYKDNDYPKIEGGD
tara:strand:- start:719 stop:940 length:222 start_codon:yes stop_codon:yes gene_type:complete